MSVPLKRKVLMWREAAQRAAEVRKRAAQARTGQVVRSTVDVGDTSVPMDEALVGGVEAGEWSAEQQEAIDLLDQDQADSVDYFLDGTGLDIEDQIDAQELADESTLSDADRWEEAAEAEESAHVAHMEAIAVSQAVDGAHAEAKAAAEVAADAKATADGKNARRRGASEPEPPEGGWVQGDQWVRDEDRGGLLVPVEILVWNGTEFVSEQVLANDVLVVGPNGVVQLKDGQVTAEMMAASFFYGREFHGGLFEGGVFLLDSPHAWAPGFTDTFETSVSGWKSRAGAAATTTTAAKHSGTRSLLLPNHGAPTIGRYAKKDIVRPAASRIMKISGWVKGTPDFGDAVRISTTTGAQGVWEEPEFRTSGAWTYFEFFRVGAYMGPGIPADTNMTVSVFLPGSPEEAYLDDFKVEYSDSPVGSLRIGRDGKGLPTVSLWGATAGDVTITPEEIVLARDGVDGVRLGTDGAFFRRVTHAGDTPWANVSVPGATGTCQWMRLAGVIYLRFDLVFNTGLAHNQALAPAFTLPEEAAPSRNTQIAVAGGADLAASGTVWDSGGVRIRNLSGATEKTMRGSGSWPAKL